MGNERTSMTVVAEPTDDSEAVSESALRSRSVRKRAIPRPREDVADPTVALVALVPAVPVPPLAGVEVLEDEEVTCRPSFVMVMGGVGVGDGDGGRGGGFSHRGLARSNDRKLVKNGDGNAGFVLDVVGI